jgi:hypothetical protein
MSEPERARVLPFRRAAAHLLNPRSLANRAGLCSAESQSGRRVSLGKGAYGENMVSPVTPLLDFPEHISP